MTQEITDKLSQMDLPFVVALTGGVASGKSLVSDMFASLGAGVVDADVIARELVEPGKPLLNSIVGAFGNELLDVYGRLKRRKLRKIIFSDDAQRARLEALMHPEIAAEAARRIKLLDAPYCLLVVPLLAEKGGYRSADRVLVVDADRQRRIDRVRARDGVDRKHAESVMAAQASRDARLSIANDVIENNGSIEELESKVAELHASYLDLASAKPHH